MKKLLKARENRGYGFGIELNWPKALENLGKKSHTMF